MAVADRINPDWIVNYHSGPKEAWQAPSRLRQTDAAIAEVLAYLEENGIIIALPDAALRAAQEGATDADTP